MKRLSPKTEKYPEDPSHSEVVTADDDAEKRSELICDESRQLPNESRLALLAAEVLAEMTDTEQHIIRELTPNPITC